MLELGDTVRVNGNIEQGIRLPDELQVGDIGSIVDVTKYADFPYLVRFWKVPDMTWVFNEIELEKLNED